jgi:arylsulfatase A-like enzyme
LIFGEKTPSSRPLFMFVKIFKYFCSLALAASGFSVLGAGQNRHVVVMVWDGMRPDFVSESNTPALFQLARHGVTFQNHHSVYLSATEVNGSALATGAYPEHDGIVGNKEYRPGIDPLKWIHTEATEAVRKGDELTHGHYLRMPTVPEIARAAGRKTAVAGAKPVTLLLDRAERRDASTGANIFAGPTLPPSLQKLLVTQFGPFPSVTAANPSRNDWTTLALTTGLWAEGVPDISFLWMNEPDRSQHETGPGSPQSLAAIRNADDNLARMLRVLEEKGVRGSTDVIVVSDHGFSTVSAVADLASDLTEAGLKASNEFKETPSRGEILIVSNSGSTLIYVIGHDEAVIGRVVGFLQGWKHSGVILTRKAMPGTFTLEQVKADSPDAPDVIVSLRWSDAKSGRGVPGLITSGTSEYKPGAGTHVSLSRFDMRNTLIAAGPDFKSGIVDVLPSGNVDVAPSVLRILGLNPPKPMDGRVLTEAMTIKGPAIKSFETRRIETSQANEKSVWHQYLNFTEVNGVTYLDEGNGFQTGSLDK